MLDLGFAAAYFLFAFAFGMLWYRTLRRPQRDQLHMLGVPVLAIAGSDLGWPSSLATGPEILGVPIAIAALASMAAVFVDLAIRERSINWWLKERSNSDSDTP
jgi:hypothetical protein